MKKLLSFWVIFLILIHNQTSFAQLSNEEVDQIINERVWCITNIIVNEQPKRPDGKWIFISGMNLVSGEDYRIFEVNDILHKNYTDNGIEITFLDRGEEQNVKLTINNKKIDADSHTYVELSGFIKNDNDIFELILTCTSLIGGSGRNLPTKDWDGNNNIPAQINSEQSSSKITNDVDPNSSPESVMNTIFQAAKSGEVGILKFLLPPYDEQTGKMPCDGDCKALCNPGNESMKEELKHNYATLNEFINYFKNARITGEITYYSSSDGTEMAQVPFWFNHPRGESRSNATMNLQRINGKWYLRSF